METIKTLELSDKELAEYRIHFLTHFYHPWQCDGPRYRHLAYEFFLTGDSTKLEEIDRILAEWSLKKGR